MKSRLTVATSIAIALCLLVLTVTTRLVNGRQNGKHPVTQQPSAGVAESSRANRQALTANDLQKGIEFLAKLIVPNLDLSKLSTGKTPLGETGKTPLGETGKTPQREKQNNPFDMSKLNSGDKSALEPGKVLTDCLEAHNKYRRMHGVPDLSWDSEVAAFSKKRSDHIAASDGAEFKHPPNLPYGENLYWHSWFSTSCEPMVKSWYDEIDLYNYNNPSFTHGTGHFTQVVWRSTTKVGCGMSKSPGPRGGIFLTCNYKPAGNMMGAFRENVPPRGG